MAYVRKTTNKYGEITEAVRGLLDRQATVSVEDLTRKFPQKTRAMLTRNLDQMKMRGILAMKTPGQPGRCGKPAVYIRGEGETFHAT